MKGMPHAEDDGATSKKRPRTLQCMIPALGCPPLHTDRNNSYLFLLFFSGVGLAVIYSNIILSLSLSLCVCVFSFEKESHSVIWAETGFHHAGQAGLKLLASSDPPTLVSQSAGIIGVLDTSWGSSGSFGSGESSLISDERNISHFRAQIRQEPPSLTVRLTNSSKLHTSQLR
ncbi:hypothetical protein AAY473_003850 [Plecturocebus cupreus]